MTQTKKNLRLHSVFTRGVTDEKKELIEESFTASTTFLNTLADELEKRIDNSIIASEQSFDFSNENWGLMQAKTFGYRQALREIRNLIVDNKSKG